MEGMPLELINVSMGDAYNQFQLLCALNVGPLCVQCYPDDQSNISSMVLMLSSEGALSQPKETGFFIERNMKEGNSLQRKHAVFSDNEYPVTLLEGG